MKKSPVAATSQKGSMFFYIFLMIALFGSLSFALSRGSRGGSGMLNKEKADLLASEIIAYGSAVKDGVKGVLISGCSDSQIVFENPVTSAESISPGRPTPPNYNYRINGAPDHCRVFSAAGAGLNFVIPSADMQDAAKLQGDRSMSRQRYYFGSRTRFNTDNNEPELVMYLPMIHEEVCHAINRKLGIGENITINSIDYNSDWPYDGTYSNWSTVSIGATGADIAGKSTGCYYRPGTPPYGQGYMYFNVLIYR